MDEIYIIIQKIGDFETVVDKAYWYNTEAFDKATELQNKSHAEGYVDFKYYIKSLEIIGLK